MAQEIAEISTARAIVLDANSLLRAILGTRVRALIERSNRFLFIISWTPPASRLERDRFEACSFMVATRDGPISMCMHNAKRDAFILQPIKLKGFDGKRLWSPVSGKVGNSPGDFNWNSDSVKKIEKRRLKRRGATRDLKSMK